MMLKLVYRSQPSDFADLYDFEGFGSYSGVYNTYILILEASNHGQNVTDWTL